MDARDGACDDYQATRTQTGRPSGAGHVIDYSGKDFIAGLERF